MLFQRWRKACLSTSGKLSKLPEKKDIGLKKNAIIPSSSEPPVYPASNAPEALRHRRVYITIAARNAMQSGLLHQGVGGRMKWRIDFEGGESRWDNPLMGWTSSRDPVQGMVVRGFGSKEEAIRFAERQGWSWVVREAKEATWKAKSYADNFLYSRGPLKFIKTK